MKTYASKARSAIQIASLSIVAISSTDAFAQFTVLDQRAVLSTTVVSQIMSGAVSAPASAPQIASQTTGIAANDLANQNLNVQASVSNDFLVTGQASLQTIATSSVVGLSDAISLTFQQQTSSLSQNLSVSGRVTVKSSLTFWVDAPTDVTISTLLPATPIVPPASLYSNWTLFALDRGPIIGGITNSPFPADALTPVQSNADGLAHLGVGKYVIEINSDFVPESGSNGPTFFLSPGGITTGQSIFRTPVSLPISRTSIKISAIPEPSTLALGLLGALGMGAIARRRRAI